VKWRRRDIKAGECDNERDLRESQSRSSQAVHGTMINTLLMLNIALRVSKLTSVAFLCAILCTACSKRSEQPMNTKPSVSQADKDMLTRRQIGIEGPIDDACANVTIAKLLFLQNQPSKEPILIEINSPGGSLTATLAILDTIEFVKLPVYTHGKAQVSGAALWLLAAGASEHRTCIADCHLSIETTTVASVGPEAAVQVERLQTTLIKLLSSRTKLSPFDVAEALKTGRSFTPAEAVVSGIVDASP
jgi:ATP-dependent Clp protease, protease subunit